MSTYKLERSRITRTFNSWTTHLEVCVARKHYDMGYNGYTEEEMYDKFAEMVESDVAARIARGENI